MHGIDQISSRMRGMIASIIPEIDNAVSRRSSGIDLATAENWLLRPELQEIYKAVVQSGISSKDLSYPQGLGGDPDLRETLADFFNKYFHPRLHVLPSHIVATPGATHCLDALLTTICDEGDSVLVPVPYWSGFSLHFQLRPRVNVIPVRLDWGNRSFDERSRPLSETLLPALEAAVDGAPDKDKVRALVITNPHNPLGQCYPARVLQECVDFCQERSIHYISDELYALSRFGSSEFTSALSLDTRTGRAKISVGSRGLPGCVHDTSEPRDSEGDATSGALGLQVMNNGLASKSKKRSASTSGEDEPPVKKRRGVETTNGDAGGPEDAGESEAVGGDESAPVHVIWSTSKDLCSSGLRMATLVSQSPRSSAVLKSIALLSSVHLSSLTSLATRHLLSSPRFPQLVSQLSSRLSVAHMVAASRFRRWGTPFIAVEAGPFVLVRLGEKQDEEDILQRLRGVGVTVMAGRSFGGSSWCDGDGGFWARITVAVPSEALWDGLHKIELALGYNEAMT